METKTTMDWVASGGGWKIVQSPTAYEVLCWKVGANGKPVYANRTTPDETMWDHLQKCMAEVDAKLAKGGQ